MNVLQDLGFDACDVGDLNDEEPDVCVIHFERCQGERVRFHEEDALLLHGLKAFERGFVFLVQICNIGIVR